MVFIFKKIEKILPSLFNQIYLFDLINIKYNRSKLLIPNLEKINKLNFLSKISLM